MLHDNSIRYYWLDVLQPRFDVHDAAIDWFASYYADWTQVVAFGTDSSFVSELRIGAPQRYVLGPRSFVVYAEDVTKVFEQHRVRHHASVCWRHAGHQAQQAVQRSWRHCWAWSLCDVCEHCCALSRGLNSSSACLSIRPSMDNHPPTTKTWLKRRCSYLAELQTTLPATMTLLPGGRDWSSANVPSPSLHHASGISCQ